MWLCKRHELITVLTSSEQTPLDKQLHSQGHADTNDNDDDGITTLNTHSLTTSQPASQNTVLNTSVNCIFVGWLVSWLQKLEKPIDD